MVQKRNQNNNYKKVAIVFLAMGLLFIIGAINHVIEERKWQRRCDGITITETCQDEDGNRCSKYIFHEAVPEITEDVYHPAEPEVTREVHHPAEPAKTHIEHHDAVYGKRQVSNCIMTTIDYKSGTCARSRCCDGEYSGSSGKGTCSHHGGVCRSGGPWYTYSMQEYLIKPAWDETVVDVPAKEAWTEVVVVSPAKDAWTETGIVSPARDAWVEKELAK